MNPDGSRSGEWPLITELRKQYDVVSVDPAQPISGRYDALLACSRRCSTPTRSTTSSTRSARACPRRCSKIRCRTSTTSRCRAPASPSSRRCRWACSACRRQMPKGDIQQLWRLLGIKMNPMEVVWPAYSPEQSVRPMQDPQWVFIDHGNQAPMPFNEIKPGHRGSESTAAPVSRRRWPRPTIRSSSSSSSLQTGVGISGTVMAPDAAAIRRPRRPSTNRLGPADGSQPRTATSSPPTSRARRPRTTRRSPPRRATTNDPADAAEAEGRQGKKTKEMNVIVVADIDWIIPSFFQIREGGDEASCPPRRT